MNRLTPIILAAGLTAAGCYEEKSPPSSRYYDVDTVDFDAPNPGTTTDAGINADVATDTTNDILTDATNDIRDALSDSGVSINDTGTDTRDVHSGAQDIRADLGNIDLDTRIDTGIDVRDASSESCHETISSTVQNAVTANLNKLVTPFNYTPRNQSNLFTFGSHYNVRLRDLLYTTNLSSGVGVIAVTALATEFQSPELATICTADISGGEYLNEHCFTFGLTGTDPIDFRDPNTVIQATQITQFTDSDSRLTTQFDLNYTPATILNDCSSLDSSGREVTNICPETCEDAVIPSVDQARRIIGLNTSYSPE
jgi:hypothetical protein